MPGTALSIVGRLPQDRAVTVTVAAALGVAAAGGAVVLMFAPPIWVALLAAGLLVFCGSLVASDAKLYWLSIFLASIPLNVTKLFFWSPDTVAVIKRTYAIYVNETMVPQIYLADLPLAMLLVIWAGELLVRRHRIEVPRALVVMIGFMAWCGLTILTTRAPLLGVSWAFYEVKLIVMFLWFVNARLDRRQLQWAVRVLLASLALQSAAVYYSYVAQTGENLLGSVVGASQSAYEERYAPSRGSGAAYVFETGSLRRGTGTIGTANLEAKYFVLLLPLALIAAVCGRRSIERLAAGLILSGALGALYLTYSRGGLLTACLGLAIVPVVLARRGLWSRRTLAVLAVGGMLAAAAATPFLLRFLHTRPGFAMTRVDHTVYGLRLWWRHPIAGVGMNNFNTSVSPIEFNRAFEGAPIHNHYLRVAIETGLVGFLLYFAFFAWAIRAAYRLSASANRFVATLAIALFAGLAAIAVYWVEDLFYDPIIRMQTWVSVALVAVLAQIAARPGEHASDVAFEPAGTS